MLLSAMKDDKRKDYGVVAPGCPVILLWLKKNEVEAVYIVGKMDRANSAGIRLIDRGKREEKTPRRIIIINSINKLKRLCD